MAGERGINMAQIKSLTIIIGQKEVIVTVKEAKDLQRVLNGTFPESAPQPVFVPSERPALPYQPLSPWPMIWRDDQINVRDDSGGANWMLPAGS